MALEPVPHVPILDDFTKDAILKRWFEQLRTLSTSTEADLAAHLADTDDAHDASAISFSPAGDIASTDVQAAIEELDTEKLSASSASAVWGVVKDSVGVGETMTIPSGYEVMFGVDFTNSGTISNSGQFHIR